MSNEFYNYIAEKIIKYFTTSGSINRGERYSLVLDDEEAVKGVNEALIQRTKEMDIQGSYQFENVYSTYTIKIQANLEVVVASKKSDVTDEFLAKLRNSKLTQLIHPILIIAYSPIDTIISGTGNLASNGMPFHSAQLDKEVIQDIDNSHMPKSVTTLLKYELEKRNNDKFTDKSSLFEYGAILSVLGQGKFEKRNYQEFSLFPDTTLESMLNEVKIKERIEENSKDYCEIQFAYEHDSIDDLEKEFDQTLIRKLKEKKRKNQNWFEDLSFDDIKKSKDNKKKKSENPLEIYDSDVSAYFDQEIFGFIQENQDLFIGNDNERRTGKRKKNILIFNKDKKDKVTLKIACNIATNGLELVASDNCTAIKRTGEILATINCNGCTFAYISISDKINSIKYEFKICIINLDSSYFRAIQTKYIIKVNQGLKTPYLQIQDVSDELVLNEEQDNVESNNVEGGQSFILKYDTTLVLKFDSEIFNVDDDTLNISIRSGDIIIPIQVLNRERTKEELTEQGAFKLKLSENKKLIYSNKNKTVSCGTVPYIIKDAFRDILDQEYQLIQKGWLSATVASNGKISRRELEVKESVINTYLALIEMIKVNRQLPSLVKFLGEYATIAYEYVNVVRNELEKVVNQSTLSDAENDLLLLGCIVDQKNEKIVMTPLQPLNILYELELNKEKCFENVRDDLICKLSPRYLLPYIYGPGHILYKAVEDGDLPGWRTYKMVKNTQYNGSRNFVKKLIGEKINEYKKHFEFLFNGMDNHVICINLIDMGNCEEVLNGLANYYNRLIKNGTQTFDYIEVNIYGSNQNENQFSVLGNNAELREFLRENKYSHNVNELIDILSSHIRCYYRSQNDDKFTYAHLTFYEMASTAEIGYANKKDISTGLSLGGLLSGVPSVLNEGYYKTGFGIRDADENELIELCSIYNSMFFVAFSPSSFDLEKTIVTTVQKGNNVKLGKIYNASNWVVFVDPKVDLSYFEDSYNSNLMIIHYSDQLSSSSSYDDITVTNKSDQYAKIIREQLEKKGIAASDEEIIRIINLFNAINGSWLLHLITAKKLSGAVDSNFSREKMSILSAIKIGMAFLEHPNVVWIPLSLEEILRVSHGTGLSSRAGILSALNLGFEKGRPTSDDILFIGLEKVQSHLQVYIHPVEVKIGKNPDDYVTKAVQQANNTYEELIKCLWGDQQSSDNIEYKLVRNFLMQLVIVSASKLKLYNVLPDSSDKLDLVLDTWRKDILNDNIIISPKMNLYIGKGTVISFKSDLFISKVTIDESMDIHIINFPEKDGYEGITKKYCQIRRDILNNLLFDNERLSDCYISVKTQEDESFVIINDNREGDYTYNEEVAVTLESKEKDLDDDSVASITSEAMEERFTESEVVKESNETTEDGKEKHICVEFGCDITNGQKVEWMPNDTDRLFHTNTGIIGTMGTGKTQFTKSLVTQLYHQKQYNVESDSLGILIFDYKGDYNQSKIDFVDEVGAKIFQPYHLPFNPLAIIQGAVFKPLVPIHTANTFKDTLSKIFNLGPKQQNTLFNCIISAYERKGILPDNPETWSDIAPTFEDVYKNYDSNEDIKKNDSLASIMLKLHQFQIFESDSSKTLSLFDLLDGIVVIDLSSYDPDIQNLIVAITLDLFYSQMQAHGSSCLNGKFRELTKFILVDEADNFMSRDFPTLKKIMKEGREFGVGTILSTQFLEHFGAGDDDYSKYILTWIVHNVSDLKASDVDFVFGTESKSNSEQVLYNDIKKLEKHHSIVKIANERPIYIEDLPFWKLIQND